MFEVQGIRIKTRPRTTLWLEKTNQKKKNPCLSETVVIAAGRCIIYTARLLIIKY